MRFSAMFLEASLVICAENSIILSEDRVSRGEGVEMDLGWREPVSTGTHLFGAIFGVVMTLFLARFTRGNRLAFRSFLVYGLSMVVLYSASTTFHSVTGSPERLFLFQKIDQSMIYFLIFGTCTPLIMLTFRSIWGLLFLGIIGLVGLIGISAIWLAPKPAYPLLVSTYIIMGMLGAFGTPVYVARVGVRPLFWLFGGAAAYVAGAICDILGWPILVPGLIGTHEIVHVTDLIGTGMHFIFLTKYVWPAYRARIAIQQLPQASPQAGPQAAPQESTAAVVAQSMPWLRRNLPRFF